MFKVLGYEVRRAPALVGPDSSRHYPFVRQISTSEFDFSLWITSPATDATFINDVFHYAEFKEYIRLVKPGARILDIGTYQGSTGMLLGKLAGPNGFLLGIDPNPANVMVCQASQSLNRIPPQCMMFLNLAAAHEPGEVQISPRLNSYVVYGHRSAEMPPVRVAAVTGDELDAQYGPFDFLKIDVEGFEQQVLMGCQKILSRRPIVAIELHLDALPDYNSTVAEIFRLLSISTCKVTAEFRGEDRREIHQFDPNRCPQSGIVNLFLEPIK